MKEIVADAPCRTDQIGCRRYLSRLLPEFHATVAVDDKVLWRDRDQRFRRVRSLNRLKEIGPESGNEARLAHLCNLSRDRKAKQAKLLQRKFHASKCSEEAQRQFWR